MLILEGHSLRTTDGSFAESLYGLRRKSARLRLRKDSARKDSSEEVQHSGLEKRQRILSVVFLVVLPYFKSKLHAIYNKEREARLRESLWGAEDQGFDEADFFTGDDSIVSREPSGNEELSVRVQLATKIKKFIAVCYPWIHASSEGLSFTYQLLYLLDATGFYSLGLQALGIQVCRATGQELVLTSSFLVEISCHHYLTMHPIELGRFGFVGWYYLKFYIHLAARCYTIID
jgi:peroxin-12